MGGRKLQECFDVIAGTSTGAIIAFLLRMKGKTVGESEVMYDDLIGKIFVAPKFQNLRTAVTTAGYDEGHFNRVLREVLGEEGMIESRGREGGIVMAICSVMTVNPGKVREDEAERSGRKSIIPLSHIINNLTLVASLLSAVPVQELRVPSRGFQQVRRH
jgi:hypothetical protein